MSEGEKSAFVEKPAPLRVSHEEVCKWEGRLVNGPIPAGVDAEEFMRDKLVDMLMWGKYELHSYCFVVEEKVREYAEGEAQYRRIQGTYWLLLK